MVYFARWKVIGILLAVVLAFVFALPNVLKDNFLKTLPSVFPHKKVNLGLDLRGGSHLLLEVVVATVIKERISTIADDVRIKLRSKRIKYKGLRSNLSGVSVRIVERKQLEDVKVLAEKIGKGIEAEFDGNMLFLRLSESLKKEIQNSAVSQSIEIVRRRIDETGTKEPDIQRQGDDRILLQLPGVDDPERVKRLLGQTAKMTFHLLEPNGYVSGEFRGRVPIGARLLPDIENKKSSSGKEAQFYLVKKRVAVSGDRLVDAQPSFDSRTNEPIVSFRFDTVGGKRFANVTRKNVNKPFAIVLDGKVVSAPVIREPILGGSGQISGGFTTQEAQDLALLLRAGALPAPLNILEERTVGPGLGADSIAAGKVASIVGLALVVIFMIVVYGLFGLFANIALFVNMVMILGVLSVLQATLTLPGIAGIVLTIGMAVDANVLVFERIREEVRAGRTPISSIDSGYARAISTIIDANLTTLIAAVILFQFGSGPIKGFAVTLMIGIITSMFTAIMLTRLMIVAWIRRGKATEVPI